MNSRQKNAADIEKRFVSEGKSSAQLLQLAIVCLAIASFFTTAQGMKNYIFHDDAIAYVTSGAIQGILLALSMSLPKYISNIWEKKAFKTGVKALITLVLLVLSAISLFCSSWFSYVYIAETIHKGSWNIDSELLVQQTYRKELYKASDYAKTYRTYLESELGQKILSLQTLANQLPTQASDFSMDWEAERQRYASDDTIASSYMATVIDQMENAFVTAPSQENRSLAAQAVEQAQTSVAAALESDEAQEVSIESRLQNYSSQIDTISRQIRNADAQTNIESLYALLSSYRGMQETAVNEQNRLQQEMAALRNVSGRLAIYAVDLGLSNSTSDISIKSNLIEMQTELFQDNPNDAHLLELATKTFTSLRDSEALSETSTDSNGSLSYSALLTQMNALVLNLNDYSDVKSIEKELNTFITELREADSMSDTMQDKDVAASTSSSDAAASSAAADEAAADTNDTAVNDGEGANQAPDETSLTDTDIAAENTDNEKPASSEARTGSINTEVTTADADISATANDATWKKTWRGRLEKLKAQISALPTFVGSSADVSEITETQQAILTEFDRTASYANLDNTTRRYINDHNALEQGTIYLTSPYRGLALFALMLAFFLDLSGFVFGVVDLNAAELKGESSDTNAPREDTPKATEEAVGTVQNTKVQFNDFLWSTLETAHPYMVVTEQFRHEDGVYYYSAFENGIHKEWKVCDTHEYPEGVYVLDKITANTGVRLKEYPQELIFANQLAGVDAQDGILLNGTLTYQEGSLLFKPDVSVSSAYQTRYIASIDEYVPVHCYDPKRGENLTQPAMDLEKHPMKTRIVVIALNPKGTRIVAIYLIINN